MRRISADRYRAPAELAWRVFLLLGLGYILVQLTMDITAAVANDMLSYGPTARLAIFAGAAFWGGCAYALYIECGRMFHRLYGPAPRKWTPRAKWRRFEDEWHVVANGTHEHVDDCPGCASASVTVLPAGNKPGERV